MILFCLFHQYMKWYKDVKLNWNKRYKNVGQILYSCFNLKTLNFLPSTSAVIGNLSKLIPVISFNTIKSLIFFHKIPFDIIIFCRHLCFGDSSKLFLFFSFLFFYIYFPRLSTRVNWRRIDDDEKVQMSSLSDRFLIIIFISAQFLFIRSSICFLTYGFLLTPSGWYFQKDQNNCFSKIQWFYWWYLLKYVFWSKAVLYKFV